MRLLQLAVGALLAPLPAAGEGRASAPVAVSGPARVDEVFQRCVGSAPVPEAEAHAAVNPADRRNVVVAWQVRGKEGGAIQVSATFDGGRTWSRPLTLPITECTGAPFPRLRSASDSWVTFGGDGRAYVAAIGFAPSEAGPDTASAVLVSASPDGGRTWQPPTAAFRSDRPFRWHDNIAIAADPTRPGTLYAATTRYEYPELADLAPGREVPKRPEGAPPLKSYGPAAFSRSLDGGRTWSEAAEITPRVEGGRVSAPQVVVDARSGRVLVIYYHAENRRSAAISYVASGDQGATWSAPAKIADFVRVPEHRHPGTNEFIQMAEDILQAAAGPDGALYVAFADGRFAKGATLAVGLAVSRDGGRTWSEPRRVSSDDGRTAWLPSLAVDASGRQLGIVYLAADARRKSKSLPVSVRLRRYAIQGETLADQGEREIDGFEYVWPGDYLALLATDEGFHAAFVGAGAGSENPTEVYVR